MFHHTTYLVEKTHFSLKLNQHDPPAMAPGELSPCCRQGQSAF